MVWMRLFTPPRKVICGEIGRLDARRAWYYAASKERFLRRADAFVPSSELLVGELGFVENVRFVSSSP